MERVDPDSELGYGIPAGRADVDHALTGRYAERKQRARQHPHHQEEEAATVKRGRQTRGHRRERV